MSGSSNNGDGGNPEANFVGARRIRECYVRPALVPGNAPRFETLQWRSVKRIRIITSVDLFRVGRYRLGSSHHRLLRSRCLSIWRAITARRDDFNFRSFNQRIVANGLS
jgi:hypothetical protein